MLWKLYKHSKSKSQSWRNWFPQPWPRGMRIPHNRHSQGDIRVGRTLVRLHLYALRRLSKTSGLEVQRIHRVMTDRQELLDRRQRRQQGTATAQLVIDIARSTRRGWIATRSMRTPTGRAAMTIERMGTITRATVTITRRPGMMIGRSCMGARGYVPGRGGTSGRGRGRGRGGYGQHKNY